MTHQKAILLVTDNYDFSQTADQNLSVHVHTSKPSVVFQCLTIFKAIDVMKIQQATVDQYMVEHDMDLNTGDELFFDSEQQWQKVSVLHLSHAKVAGDFASVISKVKTIILDCVLITKDVQPSLSLDYKPIIIASMLIPQNSLTVKWSKSFERVRLHCKGVHTLQFVNDDSLETLQDLPLTFEPSKKIIFDHCVNARKYLLREAPKTNVIFANECNYHFYSDDDVNVDTFCFKGGKLVVNSENFKCKVLDVSSRDNHTFKMPVHAESLCLDVSAQHHEFMIDFPAVEPSELLHLTLYTSNNFGQEQQQQPILAFATQFPKLKSVTIKTPCLLFLDVQQPNCKLQIKHDNSYVIFTGNNVNVSATTAYENRLYYVSREKFLELKFLVQNVKITTLAQLDECFRFIITNNAP